MFDDERSCSGLFVEWRLGAVLMVLPVRGLGAVVLRATESQDGALVFAGVSLFTTTEIHFIGPLDDAA